jgi:hypothetical protein
MSSDSMPSPLPLGPPLKDFYDPLCDDYFEVVYKSVGLIFGIVSPLLGFFIVFRNLTVLK